MNSFAANDARIIAANLPQRTVGNIVFFTVATDPRNEAIETSVLSDGAGNLEFFPDRSYVQRRLMELLGLS